MKKKKTRNHVNVNTANRRAAVTADGTPNDGHQQSSSVPGTLVSAGGKRLRLRSGGIAGVATADRERARAVLVVYYNDDNSNNNTR